MRAISILKHAHKNEIWDCARESGTFSLTTSRRIVVMIEYVAMKNVYKNKVRWTIHSSGERYSDRYESIVYMKWSRRSRMQLSQHCKHDGKVVAYRLSSCSLLSSIRCSASFRMVYSMKESIVPRPVWWKHLSALWRKNLGSAREDKEWIRIRVLRRISDLPKHRYLPSTLTGRHHEVGEQVNKENSEWRYIDSMDNVPSLPIMGFHSSSSLSTTFMFHSLHHLPLRENEPGDKAISHVYRATSYIITTLSITVSHRRTIDSLRFESRMVLSGGWM